MLSLLIFLFTFISLYPLTEMFFYRDDYMILYKLQQHTPLGFPYEGLLTFFRPIYNIFGINSYPYYLLGVIMFAISAVFLYKFLLRISDKTVAFFTTLLYATGLIGLENLIMMEYIAPIPLLIITTMLILLLFLKFFETKKQIYYLISIVIFYFALSFFAYRAHLFYAYVLFTDLCFILPREFENKKNKKIRFKILNSLFFFAIRQLPFFLIFVNWLFPSGINNSSQGQSYYLELLRRPDRTNIIVNFTKLILAPIETLNIVFPDLFFVFKHSQKIIIGVTIFIFSVIFGIFAFTRNQKKYSMIMLFALLTTLANLFAYYFYNPDFRIEAMSRYNFFNPISFNLLIVITFLLIRNMVSSRLIKKSLSILLAGIVLLFFSASFLYINNFNKTRSIPTKRFWSQIKQFMPNVPKGSLIYLDRKETLPFSVAELITVGQITTEGSFASMYKVPIKYITYTKLFDDVEKKFKEDPSLVNRIFTFFLTENGLIDTTREVRKGLVMQRELTIQNKLWKSSTEGLSMIDCGDYTVGVPPVIEAKDLSIPSFVSIKINIPIRVQPLDPSSIKYPYYQAKGSLLDIEALRNTPKTDICNTIKYSAFSDQNYSVEDILQYISYLKRYKELVQTIEISGSKTLPEDPVQHLIDNDTRTLWTADLGEWAGIHKAEIIFKFPSKISLGKIIFVPTNSQRLPKAFSISVPSEDGKTWKKIKTVKNAVMEEEKWYEVILPSTITSSLQLEITDTDTGHYPQLSELYIVEDQWKNIDINSFKSFKENQFLFVPNQETAYELASSILTDDEAAIFWKRDKDDDFSKNNYVKFPIYPDGNLHSYTVTIPAGGTRLQKLRLEGFNLPSSITGLGVN